MKLVNDIAVSYRDTTVDSIYIFTNWLDGPTDTARVVTIIAPDTFVAHYGLNGRSYVDILVIQYGDTTDSGYWFTDTISVSETATMVDTAGVYIQNNSDFPIGFGLQIAYIETLYAGADTSAWSADYYNGVKQFVLRAQYTKNSTPPAVFDPVNNYIKLTPQLTWANASIFGPYGYNIIQSDYNYLWLQMVAPTEDNIYATPRLIIVEMRIRLALP